MLAEIAEIARGDCEEGHEPDDDDDEPQRAAIHIRAAIHTRAAREPHEMPAP